MLSARRNVLIFLCVIVFLTVLSVLGANLGFFGTSDTVQQFARWGMVGVIAEIIALFVFVTKKMFRNNAYSLIIAPPLNLAGFDLTQISWDLTKCYINFAGKRKQVKPATGAVGLGFEIRLPPEVLEAITDTEPVDLELVDKKGIRWEIRPFYVFQRTVPLAYLGDGQRVLSSYGDQL